MAQFTIKIYGERNTGTNYLHQLLEANLNAKLLPGVAPKVIQHIKPSTAFGEWVRDTYFNFTYTRNLGWKHMLIPPTQELEQIINCLNHLKFITLVKNPYSWLLSLSRRPYHHHSKSDSLEKFLTQEWRTVGRENAPKNFHSPIEMWNQKNRAYLELVHYLPGMCIKYEDLLADPQLVVNGISDSLGIPRNTQFFTNIQASTKKDNSNFDRYQDYYLNERWKEKYDENTLAIVSKGLDKSLVAELGYEIL